MFYVLANIFTSIVSIQKRYTALRSEGIDNKRRCLLQCFQPFRAQGRTANNDRPLLSKIEFFTFIDCPITRSSLVDITARNRGTIHTQMKFHLNTNFVRIVNRIFLINNPVQLFCSCLQMKLKKDDNAFKDNNYMVADCALST